MLGDIKGLGIVQQYFEEFSRTGKFDRDKLINLEEFAYELENTADKINKILDELIEHYSSHIRATPTCPPAPDIITNDRVRNNFV